MALINCPECKKENISDSAVSCPNCGYKLKKSNTYKVCLIVGAFTIIAVFILIFGNKLLYGKPKELSQEAYNYGIEALTVADKYIDDIYDYNKAEGELNTIYDKLKLISNTNDSTFDYILSLDVSSVKTYMFIGTKTDVINSRNDLADTLNQQKR